MSNRYKKNVFWLIAYALLRIIKRYVLITFSFLVVYAVLLRFASISSRRKIIFIHASSGDLCLVASLLDAHVRHNGPALIIHSVHSAETFKRFCESRNCFLAPHRETYCIIIKRSAERIKDCLKATPYYWLNPCAQIIFGQLGMYPNLENSVWKYENEEEGGISYMVALRRILSLPINEMSKQPKFNSADLKAIEQLLEGVSSRLGEVALISPICYTHPGLSRNHWRSVGSALNESGFKVVFNIERNLRDTANHLDVIPQGFPTVKVPLHLLPLAGNQVGLVCGRSGGGFFISTCFLNVKKTLLIGLDTTFIQKDRRPDLSKSSLIKVYKNHGLDINHFTELSKDDSVECVYEKILRSLEQTQ